MVSGTKKSEGDKSGCDIPLLLWAIHEANTDRFVHVGMLDASKKGAACKCLCRSCGEPLLAINVDKPPEHFNKPRAQRRHFKHRHSSADEARCLSKTARLLALQLFVEQGVIYLPPRRHRNSLEMLNGEAISEELCIPAEEVRVRNRTWVDDQSAMLILDDGRQLLVTVRAHHTLNEELNSTCVLSLAGAIDPAISGWDTEKILAHLRMPGCGIDWKSHWDDAKLRAQETAVLEQMEDLYLGGIPREWLDGLDGKQIGETVLHWLIKKTIAERGKLHVPAMTVAVHQEMPDGSEVEEIAHCPATVLLLGDTRLERRLGNMVPDVICRARRADGQGSAFDLAIEAAVTHLVDDTKRKKILKSGVACLEIRADKFSRAGHVPVAEIEEMVLASTTVKQWISHPWIKKQIEDARQRLKLRADLIQKAIDEEALRRQAEEQRLEAEARQRGEDARTLQSWIQRSTDTSLVKGYLKVLKASWAGDKTYLDGRKAGTHQALWDELERRQLALSDKYRTEVRAGLLSQLLCLKDDPWETCGGSFMDLFSGAVKNYMANSNSAVVIMFALEKKRGEMSAEQLQAFDALCSTLHLAVESESTRYQRDTKNDRLFAVAFPDIASDLASIYGTPEHYTRLRSAKDQKAAREKRRTARVALVKNGRKRQTEEKEAQAVKQELQISEVLRWREFPFEDPKPALLYALHGGKAKLYGHESLELFRMAEQHRRSGQSVSKALSAMQFKEARNVVAAVSLLVHAGLCTRISASA